MKSDTVRFNRVAAIAQNNYDEIKTNVTNGFSVYPNPAKNMVTVSFAETGKYTLKLADANGSTLQTKTVFAANTEYTIRLYIQNYLPGIYSIAVTNANNKTQTLLLNKQ